MTRPKLQSEADFQASIVDLVNRTGWQHMHVRRTIGKGRKWTTGTNVKGWPDMFFWHPAVQDSFFAELKASDGATSEDQDKVIASLRAAGLEVHVWAPADWDAVEERLKRHMVARARQPIVRSAR